MLFRKAAVIVTVLLVIGAFGLGLWFWKSQNRFFSSPVTVRTNQIYLQAHAPATNVPSIDTNLYSQFQIARDTNRIQISFPQSARGSSEVEYAPLNIRLADASQTIKIGESSIRLANIGMAYEQLRTNLEYRIEMPVPYFTPDAKPVPQDALPEMYPGYQRTMSLNATFPSSQFVFVSTNIPELKALRFQAFDATTHYPLASGYSSGAFTNGFYFGSELRLWHQTPVELIATVATGPTETHSITPEEGAEIEYPGGRMRLLIISEDDLGSWSSSSDGRTNMMTFKLGLKQPWQQPGPKASFVFHSWPTAYSVPVEFEFFDHAGKRLRSYRSGSSGNLLIATIHGRVEDLKEIRLKHYPNIHRLIYTIPELPRLPEQNRDVENLFDVHIPYMHLRYEHDFQYGIGHLLQMDQQHFALTFPNGYFPSIRTNTGPRELFQELESLLANPEMQLVADPLENKIRARAHPVRAAIEAIKMKLGL